MADTNPYKDYEHLFMVNQKEIFHRDPNQKYVEQPYEFERLDPLGNEAIESIRNFMLLPLKEAPRALASKASMYNTRYLLRGLRHRYTSKYVRSGRLLNVWLHFSLGTSLFVYWTFLDYHTKWRSPIPYKYR
eukprot:TRINITY_DN551_c0_g1_i1.p1 TRINITY_DN551_c0_g1~~TRINITY_DN551_c0_g1_i1.p1  ORF type:complete len:132 (-),score=10.05 TRINITY_DN551_c0_g1_i1:84-479(-)